MTRKDTGDERARRNNLPLEKLSRASLSGRRRLDLFQALTNDKVLARLEGLRNSHGDRPASQTNNK